LGLMFYFTGNACKNGHFSKHYASSGKCVECYTIGGGPNPDAVARRQAKASGLKFFTPIKPCSNGHTCPRYTSCGACPMCRIEGRKTENYPGVQCSVEGCGRRREQGGYCPKHYVMWKNHGDPLKPPSRVSGAAMAWLETHKHYDGTDCLIWPFGSQGKHKSGAPGYGQAVLNGKNIGAHVLMCVLAHGEKPFEGSIVAHTCGKGHLGCVAPNHLKWSTYAGNSADRYSHGTVPFGESCINAKLTNGDVRRIRSLQGKMGSGEIAKMFGVGVTTVKRIHNRQTWRHLG